MATYTKNRWPLLTFLAWTVSVVRHVGYIPRNKAKLPNRGGRGRTFRGTPTCDRVVNLLMSYDDYANSMPELREAHRQQFQHFHPEVEDTQNAVKIIAWATELRPDQREKSYFNNIHNLAVQGDVTPLVAGLAASMSHAYDAAHKEDK